MWFGLRYAETESKERHDFEDKTNTLGADLPHRVNCTTGEEQAQMTLVSAYLWSANARSHSAGSQLFKTGRCTQNPSLGFATCQQKEVWKHLVCGGENRTPNY